MIFYISMLLCTYNLYKVYCFSLAKIHMQIDSMIFSRMQYICEIRSIKKYMNMASLIEAVIIFD